MDRLVDKGLAERVHDPIDRRVVICKLTPAGKNEVERFWRIERAKMEAAAHSLTLEELETVLRGLQVLSTAVGSSLETSQDEAQALATEKT